MPTDLKKRISDTYIAMAEQRGIDKVTVTDLVEECNISRQSFYYHFQDILDVVEWTLGQSVQEAVAQTLCAESREEAVEKLARMMCDNRDAINRMLQSKRRGEFEQILLDSVRIYLRTILSSPLSEPAIRYSDEELAFEFCTYGLAGLLINCCNQKDLDTDDFAKRLVRMMDEMTPGECG